VRHVAARHGVPEASLRRHFKRCVGTSKPKPAPAPHPEPAVPTVALADLRRVAAELGLPLAEFVTCVYDHMDMDVEAADEEELLDLFGQARENEDYVAAVARS
jgi:hypothetical protein